MIRYFGDYVVNSLQYQRLKLAMPSKLNDPFEFIPHVVGEIDEELRNITLQQILSGERFNQLVEALRIRDNKHWTAEQVREIALAKNKDDSAFPSLMKEAVVSNLLQSAKQTADESFRLLCFSDSSRLKAHGDILMWSHYGFAHSGYRLQFAPSFLSSLASERVDVVYSDKLVELPVEYIADDSLSAEAGKILNQALRTKGDFWDYEQETRFLIPSGAASMVHDLQAEADFLDFPANALRRVDYGINANPHVISKLRLILNADRYKHVQVFQAERSEEKFELKYNQLR